MARRISFLLALGFFWTISLDMARFTKIKATLLLLGSPLLPTILRMLLLLLLSLTFALPILLLLLLVLIMILGI